VCETIVASGDIQLRGGTQPDVVIVNGWRETKQPPSGPTRTWTSANGHKIAVKLIIAELGFTLDMSFAGTVTRKQEKDMPLMAALRKAGWSVALLIHVITVGARATVPMIIANVLKELGIVKVAGQETMQQRLAYTTAIHLNMIVSRYRKLCKTRSNNVDNICKTGVG
jgi:hypothetical protein